MEQYPLTMSPRAQGLIKLKEFEGESFREHPKQVRDQGTSPLRFS